MTRNIAKLFSIVMMFSGALGMLFSFPFLWSRNIEDLLSAGFPFVGATLLLGFGLLSISSLSREIRK